MGELFFIGGSITAGDGRATIDGPVIRQLLFAVYSAIVMFALLFAVYILSGGTKAIRGHGAALAISGIFILFYSAAVGLNFGLPFTWQHYSYYLPAVIMITGGLMTKAMRTG